MYTLTRLIPLRQLLTQEAPTFMGSLVIAELFYKFHSFTLECAAFLGTWYVLDAAVTFVGDLWKRRSTDRQ